MGEKIDSLIKKYNLHPHPEGGWFHETWRSDLNVKNEVGEDRVCATLVYFLITADNGSQWHRIRPEEIWLWHDGAPVQIDLGGKSNVPVSAETLYLSANPCINHKLHVIIPKNTWQKAKSLGDYSLISCVVAPGFDFEDFELWDPLKDTN